MGESELEAGSVAGVEGEPSTAPDPQADAPLTRAEFNQWTAQLQQQIGRGFQSWGDRLDARMAQRLQSELAGVQSWVEQNKSLGIEVPADKIEAARQQAYERALLKPGSPPAERGMEQPGQNPPDDIPPQVLQVAQDALGYMRVMGIEIEENDPEASMLALDSDDPREFMASVKEAVEAKRQRLESEQAETQQKAADRRRAVAPARNVSKPSSSDAGKSSMDYLNEAYKQP